MIIFLKDGFILSGETRWRSQGRRSAKKHQANLSVTMYTYNLWCNGQFSHVCIFRKVTHAVKVVARRDDPRTFYVPLLWWWNRSESDALNTVRRNEVPVIKEVNDSKWEINLTSNGTFPASVCARRMDRARPNVLRSQDEWTPPSLLQWTPYLLYQSEIWEEELFSGFNLWFN